MKKGYLFLLMILFLGLVACGKNTAVVATTGLLGDNGQVLLINTDDLTQPPVTAAGVNGLFQQVIVSPDGATAYVCSSALFNNRICTVDLLTKTSTYHDLSTAVFDMALTADGAKLVVSLLNGDIEIYDTASWGLPQSFPIAQSWLDPYKWGSKLVLDPKREVVYLIAIAVLPPLPTTAQVRAYKFDGTMLGDGQPIASDILPIVDDFDIAIAPPGDLLLAVSSKIYPYLVSDAGLTALNPIEAQVSERDEGTFFGKTRILFTKNTNMIYVNSAGVKIPFVTNLGGSAYCLNKQKILADDPDPFVFSLVNFINDDFIKWIIGLLDEDIANIIDPLQLYGIADSTIVGNTCYMVIAPILQWALDFADISDGKYVLAIFQTLPIIGNVWIGGKIIDAYPTSIAINPANNTLVLSYFWKKKVGVIKKDPFLGWLMTEETTMGVGNYPRALSMSTQKTSPF